ncbi:MAG TPA: GAF domain-containing protein, partial [Polyangiales bacterium]|nr:GAF domain-containing protein [Polyangiales bacterium]
GPSIMLQDLLSVWMRSEGASLHGSNWSGAAAEARKLTPSVLLIDARDQPDAARVFLDELASDPSLKGIPTLALVHKDRASSVAAVRSRANKQVAVPFHPSDVINAVASLVSSLDKPEEPAQPAGADTGLLAKLLAQRAGRGDMRGLLELLNSTASFRFTSILRFDADEQLTSMWTFDREDRLSDSFPLDATTPSSYCSLVARSGTPFSMTDASSDPRVADHPARHTVLSYCGVPLSDQNGAFFGTLCHYDLSPRFFAERTVQVLEQAAEVLKSSPVLVRERPSSPEPA